MAALAIAAVRETVIRTHDIAAFDPPFAKRRPTVRTNVACRHDRTIGAEHDQRFVQQRRADRVLLYLGRESNRVPIATEYFPIPRVKSTVTRRASRRLEHQRLRCKRR